MGLSVTSCSLDMLPLNEVVLENYWKDKQDVQNVVNSCYHGMQENKYVGSMIVWGEDRSDNVVPSTDVPAALRNLMKGSLKTTNEYCDWASMYAVINRCNTVLYYAPQVAEKDPNYTESDLRINIAECKALRAISYLTLIKTFHNVPFSLEPSIDDNAEYRLKQSKFEDILDSLIIDIESCKDYAPRRYSTKLYNTGYITRAAMYSLLAELYLWRASDVNLSAGEQNEYYRKCIAACDWVLNFKIQQYNQNDIEDEDLTKTVDSEVWSKYGYPLLSEILTNNNSDNAFNATFSTGNSFESIFEVTYHYGSTYTVNEDVGFHYGGEKENGTDVVYVAGDENLIVGAANLAKSYSDNKLFTVDTDFRSIQSMRFAESGTFQIYKYCSSYVSTGYKGQGSIIWANLKDEQTGSSRTYKQMSPNWIIYRLPEIMLFRAEAEIELAGNIDKTATPTEPEGNARQHKASSVAVEGSSLATAKELYDDAFNLICAVNARSNPACKQTSTVLPQRSNYNSLAEFEKLLMNERQREFLFEGKRYFDLVRQARRVGNTEAFVLALNNKFGEGGAAIKIKMKQLDFMYMPVYKKQMQVNPNLVQNSCYLDEESLVNN